MWMDENVHNFVYAAFAKTVKLVVNLRYLFGKWEIRKKKATTFVC